ncbi:hypothetical protein [Sphingomonas segetis]|jgi:hypothetical protein|uniref:hypothetical protein n=1 Tax=Sphingomonas segetis TaxID=1104779 RepID=UPI0018AD3BE8|nr:hypothetical protein [Sphingomonas segetis]
MAKEATPSELTEQMFAAVGRAITQWSFVEYELCKLLAVGIGGAVYEKTMTRPFIESWTAIWLFYAVENWRSRLQLVDGALTAHLHQATCADELKAEWATLSDKANDLARKRNKLAHWFVLPAQRTGTGADYEPIAPARLCPPYGSPSYYQATRLTNPKKQALTEKQVNELATAFHALERKVRDFTHKVARTQELRDRHVRLALDRLILDGRLDPPVLEALERALSSLEE